jgi:hypothetical protein
MHFIVTKRGIACQVLLWCGLVTGCFLFPPRLSLALAAIFALMGLGAGMLQGSSIRQRRAQLLAARTAGQVRAAMVSTLPGKISVTMLWLVGIALIVLLFQGNEVSTLQNVFGSYGSFALARELSSLRAVINLSDKK